MHAIIKSQLMPVYNSFAVDSKKLTINDAVKALITVHSNVSHSIVATGYNESLNGIFPLQISERFTSSQCGHYVFTPKMLTQSIVNLANYPKEDFGKALITELTNTFCNRLVNESDVQQFNEIVRGQFQRSVANEISYFVPSGPKSTSFALTAEEEWNEIVTRNVTVCCNRNRGLVEVH